MPLAPKATKQNTEQTPRCGDKRASREASGQHSSRNYQSQRRRASAGRLRLCWQGCQQCALTHSVPDNTQQSGVELNCREKRIPRAMIGLAVSFLIATSPVPVMDVLQVYGRLAGPECFGKTVPAAAGASCQLTAERIRETIGDVSSEAGFEARLAALPFRWPLKPYGTAASPSNVKTVAINKNAETAVYMRELEQINVTTCLLRRQPTTRRAASDLTGPALDAQLARGADRSPELFVV